MNDGNKKTLLIVEDDVILAMTQKMTLEKFGYKTIIANSGEKAIEIINNTQDIHLVLMDIDLGKGMDGTEAAEIILVGHDIPIIFCSSHTEQDIVEKTEKITFYGYVVKGSSNTVLNASIKMAFRLFQAKVNEKMKEEALRESEMQFRSLFQNMNSMNTLYDIVYDDTGRPCDYRYREVSASFEELVRMPAEEIIGKTLLGIFPQTEQYWLEKMEETVISGKPTHIEAYSKELNSYSEITIYSPNKGILAMTSSDTTERKQAEELLRLEKERFDLAIKNTGAGIWDWDMINNKVVYSTQWKHMLGYADHEVKDSFIGWKNLWHPDDAMLIEKAIDDYINGKTKSYEVIHRCLHKDGGWRWILTRGDILKDKNGKSIRWVGTNLDITDLKNTEKKISILLAEKETILKEVHHRIKNNMNAMNGLLSLQAGRMNDKTAIYALEDASNRMESMAVLYDQLYQSSGFTELSINTYISPLADSIISNFSGSSSVKIEKRIDDIILDAKRLQPIGIIINELLTNIMKHAFIENSKGIINLSATLEKGHVIIVVQDNGTGIPMSINFGNSTGFGLTLVHALAEQIEGDILIEREGGTRFVLDFIL